MMLKRYIKQPICLTTSLAVVESSSLLRASFLVNKNIRDRIRISNPLKFCLMHQLKH